MKKKHKTILLLFAGFVLGLIVGGLFMAYAYQKNFVSLFYGTSLTEMAVDAYQLRQGKCEHVLDRKEKALPAITLTYNQIFRKFRDEKSANTPLWAVERYYEDFSIPVPREIKPILDSLPPRPKSSCESKREADNCSDSAEAGKTVRNASPDPCE